MALLGEHSFRDVTNRPVILARPFCIEQLREPLLKAAADEHAPFTPGDVDELLGSWDQRAPYVLVWPFLAPDGTFMLQWLRPVTPTEDGYYVGHGLTTEFGAVCASFAAQEEDLGTEVLQIGDWEDLPEDDRDQVQQMRQRCEPPQGVRRVREDTRLDEFRSLSTPDCVEALVFLRPDEEPEMAQVHVNHLVDDGVDEDHWLGTVMAVVEDGNPELQGLEVSLWLYRDDTGEPAALVGLPSDPLCERDYDPDEDRRVNGDLSLAIGSTYYSQAMAAEGDERLEGFRQAERFYRLSAQLNNPQGLCNLGYIYSFGRLGYRDDEEAARCFGQAADLGHGEAAYKYGDLLSQGRGVPRDLEQAFFYYSMAYKRTRQDSSASSRGSASLRLADVLEHGTGCDRDQARAFELYLEAEQDLEAALEYEPWYAKQLQRARQGTDRLARR